MQCFGFTKNCESRKKEMIVFLSKMKTSRILFPEVIPLNPFYFFTTDCKPNGMKPSEP